MFRSRRTESCEAPSEGRPMVSWADQMLHVAKLREGSGDWGRVERALPEEPPEFQFDEDDEPADDEDEVKAAEPGPVAAPPRRRGGNLT